ncbi:hypothetical protein F5J12DRAFT_545085 [Pisolithus orientalis]|uniref:uncharacterized protein n=1 Tax=Pisolithus orientalis TaxID=936130 RepID=UPI0022246027|nr:uncharacterized protein F5J12DRAFT_545085 [Pisolithus orientalis]KAI6012663.1 hypothetical protein F5J12DRAFT_545085 [Pisolithus orientalis]
MDREVQSISQTLSVGLLDFISTTFIDSRSLSPMKPKYDKYADACSMVQEIKALREKLDATDDEDEMRALEEDITGKILWLCWCGICQEVEQLLPQVVDYLGNEGNMTGLGQIGRIIEGTHTDPNDDQAHLRRIMADAGAGTSKHQLLLTAWAAQHTLGTAVSGDKPVLGTQEAVPSTSYPGPSALAV